jgi:hypothetical protein
MQVMVTGYLFWGCVFSFYSFFVASSAHKTPRLFPTLVFAFRSVMGSKSSPVKIQLLPRQPLLLRELALHRMSQVSKSTVLMSLVPTLLLLLMMVLVKLVAVEEEVELVVVEVEVVVVTIPEATVPSTRTIPAQTPHAVFTLAISAGRSPGPISRIT